MELLIQCPASLPLSGLQGPRIGSNREQFRGLEGSTIGEYCKVDINNLQVQLYIVRSTLTSCTFSCIFVIRSTPTSCTFIFILMIDTDLLHVHLIFNMRSTLISYMFIFILKIDVILQVQLFIYCQTNTNVLHV